MIITAIVELATSSLGTVADLMHKKAGEIARTDADTARELTVAAMAMQRLSREIETIGR